MQTMRYSRVEVAERMTAAEFWRDAPEMSKVELIDGAMILPSPASRIHEDLLVFSIVCYEFLLKNIVSASSWVHVQR